MKNFFTTLFVQRRSSEIQWTLKDILRKFQGRVRPWFTCKAKQTQEIIKIYNQNQKQKTFLMNWDKNKYSKIKLNYYKNDYII